MKLSVLIFILFTLFSTILSAECKLNSNECGNGVCVEHNDINNVYTFRGQYPISKGELKVLRRSEVDRARIVWKTGYEDYDILNVDFFINQFNCLK